ncbi:UvrD-helicase domain-containing protein [Streptomyces sp. MK7]|uniref:UvrD-helicase domain-containing protein n=1 Tax=Streptomyces sp. MK7 TaxID=3067635 RepID=UPI00292FB55F|nr:UvrD-helicase domain-containing protein [Streptomyces sp. MK7]
MTARLTAPDTPADIELRRLLDGDQLGCFIMVAGAGSGKTTSLVKALDHVVVQCGSRLRARTQQVACITYTEVAAKEIHADIGNTPLVAVSTIHSFLWSLINPFQRDISKWVRCRVENEIRQLKERQAHYSSRTRATTIAKDNSSLEKLGTQLQLLSQVSRYTYGTGSDYAKGILGHEDIVSMVPELILKKELLARIVANKYPYIFVDESQDTFPNVVQALKRVANQAHGAVCLGFFGDPMQQIFQRGIGSISLEEGWVRIDKPENFRSSSAVLSVINQVRSEADGLVQVPGRPASAQRSGECFFFILPADDQRSESLEQVRVWLGKHSDAGSWSADSAGDAEGAKILMIVHRMVAKRMGFERLYAAFHDGDAKSLKDAFDEGTAWPLRPFEEVILPICAAESINSPSVLSVLRERGGVLNDDFPDRDVRQSLATVRDAVAHLRKTVAKAGQGSVGTALRLAVAADIIVPDPRLSVYLDPDGMHSEVILSSEVRETLDAFAACDVSELRSYFKYIRQQSPYSTQHGTKGAEFSKVVVVLDDEEGRYSLYSYEKLFGIKKLSEVDRKNLAAGKDSVLERTRRLLYVCVSRAIDSLAVVVFAGDVDAARKAIEESKTIPCGRILTAEDLAS